MQWIQVSESARNWMKTMGEFSPTVRPEYRVVKGWLKNEAPNDGRTYYDSSELRELAAACIEVADWLDKRAAITDATP